MPSAIKVRWTKLLARLPLADASVLIEGGRARVIRGKVRSPLLSELGDLAMSNSIEIACIRAMDSPSGFRLSFTGIPEALQQRILNLWAANRR
jgi:hypothetical protein